MDIFQRLFRLLSGRPRTAADCYYTAPNTIGPSGARPVDLDRPETLPIAPGQVVWVRPTKDGGALRLVIENPDGSCSEARLAPTEAQWLLKAVRQQNNIVKLRLGVGTIRTPISPTKSAMICTRAFRKRQIRPNRQTRNS